MDSKRSVVLVTYGIKGILTLLYVDSDGALPQARVSGAAPRLRGVHLPRHGPVHPGEGTRMYT